MHRSAVMAIRAMILLVCLVAVPLVAIGGKDALEVVKSLVHSYVGTPARSTSPTSSASDAPVFRPGFIGSAASLPAEAALPGTMTSAPGALEPLPRLPGAVQTVGGENASSNSVVATASHEVDSKAGLGKEVEQQMPPGSRPGDSTAMRFPPGYFRAAEQRLRELGATYYLLETIGAAPDQYRFVCKIAVGGQQETLVFFAIESEPLAAMDNVVRQIEGWRAKLRQ